MKRLKKFFSKLHQKLKVSWVTAARVSEETNTERELWKINGYTFFSILVFLIIAVVVICML